MVNVFLSHSSKDKPFARRLGNDLRLYGANVWIDEAEIKVGDSLIEKITEGIAAMDYLIVLLSKASVSSEWVRREVNIALTKEIKGKRVVVLPCLLEDCEIPLFLEDKNHADFRIGSKYVGERSRLINSLGLKVPKPEKLFLDQHIFYDLTDLNSGFDVDVIKYFSKSDFEKVMDRIQHFDISIYGIEPWPNGEFGGVKIYEEYNAEPNDPNWYRSAFKDFIKEGINDYFSASYGVPKKILKIFNLQAE